MAFRFRAALERETDEETKTHLRRSLGNLPFLHWLAGQHGGFMNFLMTAITVVSLIIWPVLTFWWLQSAFLPYHDNTIVWAQRAFLFFDVALLAYLWAKILDDKDDSGRWWKPWLAPFVYGLVKPVKALVSWAIRWLSRRPLLAAWVRRQWPRRIIDWLRPRFGNGAETPTASANPVTLAGVFERWLLSVFLLAALFFSFFVSTIPDSAEERWLVEQLPTNWIDVPKVTTSFFKGNNRPIFTLTSLLHDQRRVLLNDHERNDYDPTRIRDCGEKKAADEKNWNTSAKPKKNAQTPPKKPEQKCYWIDSPFPRNLILPEKLLVANKGLATEVQAGLSAAAGTTKVDDLAKAEGLSLQGRHLEYADFSQSSLPNADLRRARLKAANFSSAKLEKARLEHAELPGADLSGAELSGANLQFAQLAGANLSEAQLSGANLNLAQLSGANLSDAQLSGANLSGAQLSGADLSYAQLASANLTGAQLPGADLSYAELPGADFSYAQLAGTILEKIKFTPMNKKVANAETDKLYSALKDLPRNQADLIEEMNQFHQKITRSVHFSKLVTSEGCLVDESALKDLKTCKKIGDPEAQKKAYETWARLACQDDTEKHWVAQRMVQRIGELKFPEKDSRFRDFAQLLAAKLQIPDKCPGLASLDDKSKKILLDAVKKTP